MENCRNKLEKFLRIMQLESFHNKLEFFHNKLEFFHNKLEFFHNKLENLFDDEFRWLYIFIIIPMSNIFLY
ncbi:hypothetical protein ES705_09022 [subsurface metagenome]